jgi:hypothetical protein
MGFAHLTDAEGKCEWIDDEQVSLTLRVAVVGKGIERPRCGYCAVVCLRGRIELVSVHSTRVGIVCVLPAGSLSGDGCGVVVGGFGRRHHAGEPGRVLSGESPLVVQFSKGLRVCGIGRTGSSVSSVLAVDAFLSKATPSLRRNREILYEFTDQRFLASAASDAEEGDVGAAGGLASGSRESVWLPRNPENGGGRAASSRAGQSSIEGVSMNGRPNGSRDLTPITPSIPFS